VLAVRSIIILEDDGDLGTGRDEAREVEHRVYVANDNRPVNL